MRGIVDVSFTASKHSPGCLHLRLLPPPTLFSTGARCDVLRNLVSRKQLYLGRSKERARCLDVALIPLVPSFTLC